MGSGQCLTIRCYLRAKENWPLCRTTLCVSREGFWSTGAGSASQSIMVTQVEGRMGMNLGLLLPVKVRPQRSATEQQLPSTLSSEQPVHLPTPQERRRRKTVFGNLLAAFPPLPYQVRRASRESLGELHPHPC